MSRTQVDGKRRTGRVLWGRIAVLLLALGLVFVLGRCTAGDEVPRADLEQAQERVTELEAENRNLQEQVRALEAGGVAPADAGDAAPAEPAPEEAPPPAEGPPPAEEGAAVPEEPPPGDEGTLYVVQAGDTLQSIAQQVYGDGSKFPLIAEANDVVAQELTVGQELRIPPDPEPG